jgi:group I intron endonuclease
MSKIYSIYKATNKINGKSYIGFDSKWPRRKHKHHFEYKERTSKFYNAIKKYGWDNFEWEVVYQSKDGKHCLETMELKFIKEYNSFNNGYNSTPGGDGVVGYKHNNERRKKISMSAKNRKLSDETKKKMSESKSGINNHNYQKPMSAEQKKKISDTLKGNVPWNKGVKGKQKSPNRTPVIINGVFYECKADAMVKLKISLYKLNKIITSDEQHLLL